MAGEPLGAADGARAGLLYAFYDLTVAPVSFDVFAFLVEAERVRRTRNLSGIHVVVVPKAADRERLIDLYSETHERWRLQQIVTPACGLLPSVVGMTVCTSREQAASFETLEGPIFPERYTTQVPIAHHHLGWVITHAHLGTNMHVISASAQARAYARQWIDAHAQGRKVVALTLREAGFTPKRNSDVGEWVRFAKLLQTAGFFPVILRDTDYALDPSPTSFGDIALFPEATFNLDLRIAFYEEAHICAFVSNGPASVCFFDRDVRYLYFVTGEFLDHNPPGMLRVGIDVGTTPPFCNVYQRWIWTDQDADRFMDEFLSLDRTIDRRRADGTYEQGLAPVETYREPPEVVADRMRLWSRVHGSVDDWEIVAFLMELTPGLLYVDINYTIEQARVSFACHNFDRAIDLYRHVLLKEPSEATYLELGLVFEALNRHEDARAIYREAAATLPRSLPVAFRLHLAEAACGNAATAIAFLSDLIRRGAKAPQIFGELAKIYEAQGDLANSQMVYKTALERGIDLA
jgi:tetratricopeptide (TPR) repeat protein